VQGDISQNFAESLIIKKINPLCKAKRMKTAYAIALFTASTQAISMETMAAYAQGDSAANGYDPTNV
jgi:Na+/H+-dicarboxylate symporter